VVETPGRYVKSRSFAVVLVMGPELLVVHSLVRWRSLQPAPEGYTKLIHQSMEYNLGDRRSKDDVIAVLKMLGSTVRFYDEVERKWMDDSTQYGLVSVRGSRDGQWGVPDLEEFEEDYLEAV